MSLGAVVTTKLTAWIGFDDTGCIKLPECVAYLLGGLVVGNLDRNHDRTGEGRVAAIFRASRPWIDVGARRLLTRAVFVALRRNEDRSAVQVELLTQTLCIPALFFSFCGGAAGVCPGGHAPLRRFRLAG